MNKNLMKLPEKEGKFRNLMDAAFPRVSALNGHVAPWSARAGIASLADLASLPGRAYVSIGRPEGESYVSALGRTEPRYDMASYQGEGDELAETILRDPTLPLGVGLGRLASGLGKVGRVALDALGNAGMTAGSQYATSGQVDPLAIAMAAGLGAAPHAMPGKAPVSRIAGEITPEQRAANFKNWFGDSKMVDEAGNPLVVYHGSKYGAPEAFKPDRGYIGAAFFTDNQSNAQKWAKGFTPEDGEFVPNDGAFSGDVVPAHISAKKPITDDTTLEEVFGSEDEAVKYRQDYEDGEINYHPQPFTASMDDGSDIYLLAHSYAQFPKFREYLRKRGYDAFDYYDMESGGRTIVPFDPTQIKSATGNRGTFDPTDPNITHFAGRAPTARQSTPIQALGNRLSAGAKQAVFRNLMGDSQNRGDTYYTRGGSR